MPAERRKCPTPVENAIIHDNATTNTAGTITKILQYWSVECHSTLPVLSTSVRVTKVRLPYKSSHCVGKKFVNRKGI